MSSINTISPEKLFRLVGTPNAPTLIDVRLEEDFAAEPRLIPASTRRSHLQLLEPSAGKAKSFVVVCRDGCQLSHGVAAWIRQSGASADILEGGIEAWASSGLPMIPTAKLPKRDQLGRTVWVTRERPKI